MQLLAWACFLALIGALLSLDLGVFHRGDQVVSAKSALRWTFIWFAVAMVFNVGIYFAYQNSLFGLTLETGRPAPLTTGGPEALPATHPGRAASVLFFTGFIVEQSLSIDNIFVMALLFRFFKVDPALQHRVLFWGILGAVVLRISMILLGATLISHFSFMTYVFGAILIFTAGRMALSKGDDDFNPEDSRIVKLGRKLLPISPELDGHRFFTRVNGKRMVTPLLLVLLVVEATDVVFAVDSIPAIFGVTTNAFIVFTSNIFAILGLRSLYFALASLLRDFHYLKHSLVVVLAFVGVKMILAGIDVHIPALISLGVIAGCIGIGVVASLLRTTEEEREEEPKSHDPSSQTPGPPG